MEIKSNQIAILFNIFSVHFLGRMEFIRLGIIHFSSSSRTRRHLNTLLLLLIHLRHSPIVLACHFTLQLLFIFSRFHIRVESEIGNLLHRIRPYQILIEQIHLGLLTIFSELLKFRVNSIFSNIQLI